MNPFELSIPAIRVELPVSGIIEAATLDGYLGVAAVMTRTRSRAAALLREVRRQRAESREAAAALLEEARRKGKERAEIAVRQAEDAVVGDVVAWLVAERDLEACVAARLATHCRAWVAQAVAQFAGEVDRSALIATRIDAQVRRMTEHGALTVRVAPEALESIRARLSASAPFELIGDPALRASQASLDSPYVCLRIDLDRHLDDLLRQIRGEAEAEADAMASATQDAPAEKAQEHQTDSNGQ